MVLSTILITGHGFTRVSTFGMDRCPRSVSATGSKHNDYVVRLVTLYRPWYSREHPRHRTTTLHHTCGHALPKCVGVGIASRSHPPQKERKVRNNMSFMALESRASGVHLESRKKQQRKSAFVLSVDRNGRTVLTCRVVPQQGAISWHAVPVRDGMPQRHRQAVYHPQRLQVLAG